ncbi:flagellar hook-associated protein FlgK [Cognatishimia sp. SS12]|uniref:flagellar hook-associated protein FlgK n=1 Tax=Cognatishimia sp. SS12 TaxID=2979465 RepID=UPI00232DEC08|nr:flagellar hook-associated protein FlgK [Cognatishimia sp. SS12]MDC0739464.1 flagellar hook-associated protein FlgK [Cognatishimia sp. SS12]
MSLSGALYTATAGLNVNQSLSRVTAGNVANAMTEGYARRDAHLVSTSIGTGGVQVAEIRREVDAALVRMSRNENSKMAEQQAIHEGLRDYTLFLGQIGDGASPAEKFSAFNSSMTTLVNLPSSAAAQQGAVFAAEDLAASIRDASDRLANVRADVDMEIRYEVSDLNDMLYQLRDFNTRLGDFAPGSHEAAAFHDQIAKTLDQVSGIVDIRVTQTADGWVNVYTTGGAALLEGDRVQDVTYNPGDGSFFAGSQEITPGEPGVRGIEHGSLAGFATLKRETIPQFQLQLDEYARGLIQSFEAADATLTTGQAGLFTDNGFAFDAANLEGLASRLRVNEALHAGAGGSAWLIRDGLGATAQGPASSATQIQAFIDGMNQSFSADPGTGINAAVTLADFGAEVVTAQGTATARAEQSYNAARSAAEVIQASRQNVEGVNIDEEMQKLMMIEQSFAANSKMLTAVAEMLDTLLAAV